MQIIIHRGAKQIGGSCVEVATATTRVILDAGLPLEAPTANKPQRIGNKSPPLPAVPGLFSVGPKVDAVLLSHAHGDHAGLLNHVRPEIPIYLTEGTSKMLLAGALFAGQPKLAREREHKFLPQESAQIGRGHIQTTPHQRTHLRRRHRAVRCRDQSTPNNPDSHHNAGAVSGFSGEDFDSSGRLPFNARDMKSALSMIGKDGSLSVQAQEVTWFQFLKFSRATNSEAGGWNSVEHWIERGLTRLDDRIVKKWTSSSFDSTSLPQPRKGDFKLSRRDTKARELTRAKGEKALAAGNVLKENQLNSLLHGKKHWPAVWGDFLSYEVPLADKSNGQLKVDLLATGKDPGTGDRFLSLIELKQAKSPSNSPLMALTEAICYAVQIQRCRDEFIKEMPALSGRDWSIIRLILAAPKGYWDDWTPKKSPDWHQKMDALVKAAGESFSPGCRLALEMFSLNCKLETKPV